MYRCQLKKAVMRKTGASTVLYGILDKEISGVYSVDILTLQLVAQGWA